MSSCAVAQRHEVDQRDGAVGGLEVGLEDQRVGAVAARDARRSARRGAMRQRPCSGVAEQRGEAGAGVEARPAQPVDRAVAADQRGGLAVADQRVVLDARWAYVGLAVKSMMTLMSSGWRSSAVGQRSSGTRRVISRLEPGAVGRARAPRPPSRSGGGWR